MKTRTLETELQNAIDALNQESLRRGHNVEYRMEIKVEDARHQTKDGEQVFTVGTINFDKNDFKIRIEEGQPVENETDVERIEHKEYGEWKTVFRHHVKLDNQLRRTPDVWRMYLCRTLMFECITGFAFLNSKLMEQQEQKEQKADEVG